MPSNHVDKERKQMRRKKAKLKTPNGSLVVMLVRMNI